VVVVIIGGENRSVVDFFFLPIVVDVAVVAVLSLIFSLSVFCPSSIALLLRLLRLLLAH